MFDVCWMFCVSSCRECLRPASHAPSSLLLQGSAHSDDASSLNNSHGGLPSASSTSSTELNHQVESFRGLLYLLRLYTADSNNMGVAQTQLKLPSSSPAGLPSALAGQVPSTLELKVEKPDKDDMRDDLSENKSDDESDKNMRTPRAGTRTRYRAIVTLISHIQTWERQNNIYLLFKNKSFFYGHVISSKMVLSFTVSLKMRTSIQSRRPSVSVREGWLTMPVSA